MEIKPWSKEAFTEASCGFFWDQFNLERAKKGKVGLDRFMGAFSEDDTWRLVEMPYDMVDTFLLFSGMKSAADIRGYDQWLGSRLNRKLRAEMAKFFKNIGSIFFDPSLVAEVVGAAGDRMRLVDSVASATRLFELYDGILTGSERGMVSDDMDHDYGILLGYIPKDVEIWCDINLGQNSQLEDVA